MYNVDQNDIFLVVESTPLLIVYTHILEILVIAMNSKSELFSLLIIMNNDAIHVYRSVGHSSI